MKIGIDARLNAYRQGGIADYTRHLIRALANIESEAEYNIIHHRSSSYSLIPNTQFKRRNVITPPHYRWEAITLGLELLPYGLDILHSPDFIPPRLGADRNVITIHDLNFIHYPQFQTPDSLAYYKGNIERAIRQAAHILADSTATKTDLQELFAVSAEKITVHPLGVTSDFQPLKPATIDIVRRRLGLPSHYFLFVGTFEPRKNIIGLLKAYHLLRQTYRELPMLVIVGRRGWLFEEIFETAAQLKLDNYLRWFENASSDDLPAIYNGAAVLVLPSFYEGFGLTPLQAMACGIPTVVSKRGSLPEVVGETGLLVNPEDIEELAKAMYYAINDSQFRFRSRVAGLERAKQFTWQKTAEITYAVYQQVFNS